MHLDYFDWSMERISKTREKSFDFGVEKMELKMGIADSTVSLLVHLLGLPPRRYQRHIQAYLHSNIILQKIA